MGAPGPLSGRASPLSNCRSGQPGACVAPAESGVITLASFISPYRSDRDKVRARMAGGDFVEVYMRIPIELCEERDPKGLYKAARAGKIKNFTGARAAASGGPPRRKGAGGGAACAPCISGPGVCAER